MIVIVFIRVRATKVVIVAITNVFNIGINLLFILNIRCKDILCITRWLIQLFTILKFIELLECFTMKMFYYLFQFPNFMFQLNDRKLTFG